MNQLLSSSTSPQKRKREYLLADDEDDETENSGFTVSSVDEELPSIIAPSTKILRFPMK